MPLTFLAGQHGFGIFVPYLGMFLVAAHFLRNRRLRGTRQAIDAMTATA